MKSQTGIYRWSKILRTETEVATWEAVIEASKLVSATIFHIAGKKSCLLEIFDTSRVELEAWKQQFGGEIEHLTAPELEAMSQPPLDGESEVLKIRDRLLVTQSVDGQVLQQLKNDYPERIVLSYPPALAFGTGDHATTATCLRLICDFSKERNKSGAEPWSLLDLGCGSGILCAAANALGAQQVLGIDFDEMAVRTARRLAGPNGLNENTLIEGDVLKWQAPHQQTYDLIGANIFHDVLIEVFPMLPAWLKNDGQLIISGILNSQEQNCLSAGEKAGFVFDRVIRKGKWSTAHGTLAG